MIALLIRHWPYVILSAVGLIFILWVIARLLLLSRVAKERTCPRCHGDDFYRVHRRPYERFLGAGMKIRRYRCANPNCNWEGLRRHRRQSKSAAD